MNSILVTGANRGIGLGLIRQLMLLQPRLVLAACRTPDKAVELRDLAGRHENLRVIQLDVSALDSFASFSKQVATETGADGLQVLINNAGISSKFARVGLVRAEHLTQNYLVNAVAPLMLTKALLPLLQVAAAKSMAAANAEQSVSDGVPVVLNLGSIMASMSQNREGGAYPYRASKAALNAITVSLATDLRRLGIIACVVHPGWVQTEMGGSKAPLTVDQSAAALVTLLSGLQSRHSGKFLGTDGVELPW